MTNKQHTTRRRVDSLSDDDKDLLYGGANISQLAILFGLDNRTVSEKIHECPPTGSRNGTAVWKVKVAAPYLIKPILEVEDYIRKMHPSELPKTLSKEYWAAQKSRNDVLKMEGDLWDTERVIKAIGSIFKLIKVATKVMNDQVDAQAELTVAQRRIIKGLNDSLLNQLYNEVTEAFDAKAGPTNENVQQLADEMIERVRAKAAQEDDDEL